MLPDVLCEVDGQPIQGMSPQYFDRVLLGEKDTWVQMKFQRRTDAKAPKLIAASDPDR